MQTRLRTAKLIVACVATALAVALSGCSGDDDEPTKTVTVSGEEQGSPAQGGDASTAPEESDQTTPETEESDEDGIVSGEGSIRETPVRFVLTELKRSGNTVELSARLESLATDEDGGESVSAAFSDGESQELSDGSNEGEYVADGLALIDTEGSKKYLVARDETGRCVCSNNLLSTAVYPGAPVSIQATLSAPPEGVETIDLVVPSVQTFTDVPLEE